MTEEQLYQEVNRLMSQYDMWGLDPRFVSDLYKFIKSHYVKEVDGQSFLIEFREIFPSKKLPTGKNFKSNLKDLEMKMKFFIKNYNYSPETILEAARQYVAHAQNVDYQFIRTAAYFVYKKGEGSDLADWCERVLNDSPETTIDTPHKFAN